MKESRLRIMAIGAHPDDCEVTTGGTCLKYSALGHKVKFVYATNGDAGHHVHSGAVLAGIRAAEASQACGVGGFEHEIMDNHDGYLEANIRNRDNLIRIIRKFRPDLIFTHRTNDYHSDHRNTGLLVQDTAYLLMVPNVCPDTPALDYAPIMMYMPDHFRKPAPFEPTVVVDIDDVFAEKVRMAGCHKSQFYEWLPWIGRHMDSVPSGEGDRFIWLTGKLAAYSLPVKQYQAEIISRYGEERAATVKCIEAFERSEYGGILTDEMIPDYFPL
jgi:LmbE family N-acetylglucosaminyl deacetylase